MHISLSDVFSSCYRSDESRSFTLLIRKSPVWGGTTCLQMGMSADARLFFSHDGVQVGDFMFCLNDIPKRADCCSIFRPSSFAVELVVLYILARSVNLKSWPRISRLTLRPFQLSQKCHKLISCNCFSSNGSMCRYAYIIRHFKIKG